jgi:hypothetical protein
VNGVAQPADSLHVLCIGRLRMRLARGASVAAKEFYSSSMQVLHRNHFHHLKCAEELASRSLIVGRWYSEAQRSLYYLIYTICFQLCGVRGGGDAAPQAIFWQPRKELSFVLGFETTRERNSALMLARRFAMDCNVSGRA